MSMADDGKKALGGGRNWENYFLSCGMYFRLFFFHKATLILKWGKYVIWQSEQFFGICVYHSTIEITIVLPIRQK